MNLNATILFTTMLLAIVNPIGSAVLFAALVGRFSSAVQRQMADQGALAVLIILLACSRTDCAW